MCPSFFAATLELSSITPGRAGLAVCGASLTLAGDGSVPFATGSYVGHCSNTNALEGSNTGVTGVHCFSNIVDGVFGNGNSWIPNGAGSAGVAFPSPVTVGSIAFGRDVEGGETNRYSGPKSVQYTRVVSPGLATPDSDWITAGQVTMITHLRHVYSITEAGAPVENVTGLRIHVSAEDCIDELEVYGTVEEAELCPGECEQAASCIQHG